MTGKSHSSIHDFPSLLMQPSSSSSLGRSRRLEEMGAGTNEAHDRDTHVSLARPILSWTHYFQAGYSSSFCEEKCFVTKQRTVFHNLFVSVRNMPIDNYCLRTTSKRPVGTVFNYKTTYHTLSSSASSSPVRSSSSLSLSSDGSSTTTQNEYFKI